MDNAVRVHKGENGAGRYAAHDRDDASFELGAEPEFVDLRGLSAGPVRFRQLDYEDEIEITMTTTDESGNPVRTRLLLHDDIAREFSRSRHTSLRLGTELTVQGFQSTDEDGTPLIEVAAINVAPRT